MKLFVSRKSLIFHFQPLHLYCKIAASSPFILLQILTAFQKDNVGKENLRTGMCLHYCLCISVHVYNTSCNFQVQDTQLYSDYILRHVLMYYYLLAYDAFYSGRWTRIFRRYMLSPSLNEDGDIIFKLFLSISSTVLHSCTRIF